MSKYEARYRGRIGHITGEERVSPATAREAAFDALANYPFEFPERYDEPIIERRFVTAWEPTDAGKEAEQ